MHIDNQDYDERADEAKATPLPKLQVLIIMIVMLAEPLSSTVIYPFVNQAVRDTGITNGDERKVGHYAGLLESAFFLAECTTVFQWGRLSDQIGRRPVLLLGPLGLAASLFTFGFSSNYWTLFLARCAQGAFNGNIGVTKTMMTEITDATNIAQAYAWLPVMWSSGITLGPLIGGLFAQPARRWPQLSHIAFLVHHPYFAPCAITGTLAFASFLVAYMGLKETLRPKDILCENEREDSAKVTFDSDYSSDEASPLLSNEPPRKYGAHQTEDSSELASTEPENRVIPLKELLSRPLLIALVNHGLLAFLDQSHQAIMPLMYSTSISLGGLGLRPRSIGLVMGIWGACNAVFQVLFFSRIVKRLGTRSTYMICVSAFLVTFTAFPILNLLAKVTGSTNAMVWIMICLQMSFYTAVFMGYGCMQLFIMDAAPTRNSRGAVNALGQMVSSVTRTVAPAVVSSLFSLSISKHLLGGYLVYLFILSIVASGVYTSTLLPKQLQLHGGR